MLSRFLACLAAPCFWLAVCEACAMDLRIAGYQLILSGPIIGDEYARMCDVLPMNKQIDTVVLKDSGGGDVWDAFRSKVCHIHGTHDAFVSDCNPLTPFQEFHPYPDFGRDTQACLNWCPSLSGCTPWRYCTETLE